MDRKQASRLWAVILAEATCAGTAVPAEPDASEIDPLRSALERAELAIPAQHTVVIGTRCDQSRLAMATAVFPGNVLIQPRRRGFAPLILWPIYWIHRFDPEATVAVIPVTHHDRDNPTLMNHVVRLAQRVQQTPDWLLVVGSEPTDSAVDHDWIVRAECLTDDVERVWRVSDLQNAASRRPTGRSSACNRLWNTGVVVGRAETFLEASRECLPGLHRLFFSASRLAGTLKEAAALDLAYSAIEDADFFAALRDGGFPRLAASCLQPSDDVGLANGAGLRAVAAS